MIGAQGGGVKDVAEAVALPVDLQRQFNQTEAHIVLDGQRAQAWVWQVKRGAGVRGARAESFSACLLWIAVVVSGPEAEGLLETLPSKRHDHSP